MVVGGIVGDDGSNAGTALDRMHPDDVLGPAPWTPEAEAVRAQSDALAASANALLYGEARASGYQTHSVARGDRLEAIARSTYGEENYRAALPLVMADNDIQLNRYGSPMIYPGDELVLRDIGGMDSATFAQASAMGGDFIANNSAGLMLHRFDEAMRIAQPILDMQAYGDALAARAEPSLGQLFSAAVAGVRDRGVAWAADTLWAVGKPGLDLSIGYQFDVMRLVGVPMPEFAPSLIGGIEYNMQTGASLVDAVQRPEVQREALVWVGLTNPVMAHASASELAGRAHTAWQNLRADYEADPLGTTYNVAGGLTYGGLTVASLVVAPEMAAARVPALFARLPRVRMSFAHLNSQPAAIAAFPRVQVTTPRAPIPYTGRRWDVRAKFVGSPAAQVSSDGHAFRSRWEAYRLALDPDVTHARMNAGYVDLLGLEAGALRTRRPDAAALYSDGRIARVEVMSDGDLSASDLIRRNTRLDRQLRRLGYNPLRPTTPRPTRVDPEDRFW